MSSLNPLSPVQTTTPLIETSASDSDINERHIYLQFALIGDHKTGKTSILNQFTESRFNADYHTTTSPTKYTAPQIIINDRQTNKKYMIQLQLWDTVGELPPNYVHMNSTNHPVSSKKHTNTSVANTSKSHKNMCVHQPMLLCPDPNENELDLISLFSEMDAKEAIEDCVKPPPPPPTLSLRKPSPNTNKENIHPSQAKANTTHIDYKTLHGYSSPETLPKAAKPPTPILEILNDPDPCDKDNKPMRDVQQSNRFLFESIDALILVYDVTDHASLSSLDAWMQCVADYTMDSESIPILIIGNKTDLSEERCVSYKEGRKFCHHMVQTHKLFKEISAKNGDKEVTDMFTALARMCIDKDYEILQWISSDSVCSAHALSDYKPPTYKRTKTRRSNDFFVKTCAHNFCSKQKEDIEDPMFCVVL